MSDGIPSLREFVESGVRAKALDTWLEEHPDFRAQIEAGFEAGYSVRKIFRWMTSRAGYTGKDKQPLYDYQREYLERQNAE
jgi:hypothetical protein